MKLLRLYKLKLPFSNATNVNFVKFLEIMKRYKNIENHFSTRVTY